MQIEIYCDQILIGRAELNWLDPPMGVAGGTFVPLQSYELIRHAFAIGAKDNPVSRRQMLTAKDETGAAICCEAVEIWDGGPGVPKIEVELLGIPHSAYALFFKDHPQYVAYHEGET